MSKSFVVLGLASALAFATSVEAQLVQIGGLTGQSGGGLGSQATVLTLQSPGNTSNATGCVSPTGSASCGFANANVQNGQTQTRMVSDFPGLTGSNFRIQFNASEPQNAESGITLNNLVLTLYGTGNNTFTRQLAGPLDLVGAPGTGNFGYLFGFTN